jgi:multidrug/microcin transport system ATP-binding/permease protein
MLKLSFRNIFYLVLYAVPNTFLSLGILYIINSIISSKNQFQPDYMGMVFVAAVVYTYLLNIIFQNILNKYSFQILYSNEKQMFERILSIPLPVLEKMGSQRFYTVIEDLRIFASLPEVVTHTINSLLMLLLCIVYMFTLSLYAAVIVLVLIVLIAGVYFIIMNSMTKKVLQLRNYNEGYYKYVNDVVNGFKELKLSFARRSSLLKNFLIPNRDNARDLDYKVNFVFLSINLISQYGLYLVIGAILFLLPAMGLLSAGNVVSYVVILLFIAGPINNLINMQNIYTRYMAANKRINTFLKDFCIEEKEEIVEQKNSDFESVEFMDISFSYDTAQGSDKGFALGPVDLFVKKGETIFIVGGNGSGKSTFINLLTGLYKPTEGKILLNGAPVSNIGELQQQIAAVFTNNHLFSNNYENFVLENNGKYKELLRVMEMDSIVKDDQDGSARRGFSKGQSKRMSLIFALLEQKPILVLDEWAADQDPYFRKYFYEKLLPLLKEDKKTIIAVTHDDAYFKHADRIIKFDYGHITKVFRPGEGMPDEQNIWYND